MKLRAFIIVTKGNPDFKIGEKLHLLDAIEKDHYIELSSDMNYLNFNDNFNSQLLDSLSFHKQLREQRKNLNDYYKEYLIITSKNFIVQGFFRI